MLKGWHVVCAFAYFVIIYDRTKPLAAQPITTQLKSSPRQIRAVEQYTSRFDYINVDDILKSKRLVKNYFNCIMDRGPCTREGAELKRVLPDAVATECAKCTEVQRTQAGKVLAHLLDNNKDLWDQLLEKFDSDGTLRKKYFDDDDEYNDEEED